MKMKYSMKRSSFISIKEEICL